MSKTRLRNYYRTIEEGRMTPEDAKKLSELRSAVSHLRDQVSGMMVSYPDRGAELSDADQRLKAVNTRIGEMQRKAFARKYF
jgi:hypothetical protein